MDASRTQEMQRERVERERERLVWEERLAALERITASNGSPPSNKSVISASPLQHLSPTSSLLLQLQVWCACPVRCVRHGPGCPCCASG